MAKTNSGKGTTKKVVEAMQEGGILPKGEGAGVWGPVAMGVLRTMAKPFAKPTVLTIPYAAFLVWAVCGIVGFVTSLLSIALGAAAVAGVGMIAYKHVTGREITLPGGETIPEWLRLKAGNGQQ